MRVGRPVGTPLRPAALAALWFGLAGCFYVTREEYDAAWDADGDGWPLDEDCAVDDPAIHPFAPDRRGDGCDSDCGGEPDADLDDWPDGADCDPADPAIHPCAPDVDGDGVDADCDGHDGPRTDPCVGEDPAFPGAAPIPEGACPEDLIAAGAP